MNIPILIPIKVFKHGRWYASIRHYERVQALKGRKEARIKRQGAITFKDLAKLTILAACLIAGGLYN